MPKLSINNRRYRTKQTICKDIAYILNSPISIGTKIDVLAEVTWIWSEFDGKYIGCKNWSKLAIQSGLTTKGLIHEHSVPKKILIDMLLGLQSPTAADVNYVLETYCVGVIVTLSEDASLTTAGLRSSMPIDWDGANPFARYDKVNIEVAGERPL